jgi:hypothetical protein
MLGDKGKLHSPVSPPTEIVIMVQPMDAIAHDWQLGIGQKSIDPSADFGVSNDKGSQRARFRCSQP